MKRREQYPEEGLTNLNQLSEKEFLELRTHYTSNDNKRCYTVGDVHSSAEAQVSEYKQCEKNYQQETDQCLEVKAFAITLVCDRAHVTEI